jgi:hypothetical protein
MVLRSRSQQPVTEQVWLDLLQQELGDDGVALHQSMLAGGLMLPESDDFSPGFRRVVAKIRRFDLGFDMGPLVGATKRIQGLKPDSEAAKAGLENGDVISYATGLDALQRDVTRTFDLTVTRAGKTFPISYLPRGEAVEAWQWERVPGAVEPARAAASGASAAAAQGPPRPSNDPQDFLREPPRPSSLAGPFTLTAVGELLYSHPLANTTDEEMQKVFALVRRRRRDLRPRRGAVLRLRRLHGSGLRQRSALGRGGACRGHQGARRRHGLAREQSRHRLGRGGAARDVGPLGRARHHARRRWPDAAGGASGRHPHDAEGQGGARLGGLDVQAQRRRQRRDGGDPGARRHQHPADAADHQGDHRPDGEDPRPRDVAGFAVENQRHCRMPAM